MGKKGNAFSPCSIYISTSRNLNIRNMKNWKNHSYVKLTECVTTYSQLRLIMGHFFISDQSMSRLQTKAKSVFADCTSNNSRRIFSKILESPLSHKIDLPRPWQAQMLFLASIWKLELRTMWNRKIEKELERIRKKIALTSPTIKVDYCKFWCQTNINKGIQRDHKELICCTKGPSSLGSCHKGYINWVV